MNDLERYLSFDLFLESFVSLEFLVPSSPGFIFALERLEGAFRRYKRIRLRQQH